MTTRIACTALTGRIVQGRVNAAGNTFIGEKKDITSDVLKALIDKAEFHGGEFDIAGDGEKWVVKVSKVPAKVSRCSEERPCIPCFSDDGECIGPAPTATKGAES